MKKVEFDFKQLVKLINPKKLRILKIIGKGENLNQMQIQEKMGLSYRQTRRYIDSLYSVGILNKKRFKAKKGKPIIFSLKKRKK